MSLVEALVVIAILVILLGLTTAGVQRVRATAARSACLNQMRQIGQALHQYESVHRVLPPGVTHPALHPGLPRLYGPDTDPYPLLNWQARLLPYVEQETLWSLTEEAYARDRHAIETPPHIGMITSMALFLCPSDTRRTHPELGPERTPAMTSYLGVSGTNNYRNDGVFFLDSRLRFRNLTDGTSNTVMVGERPPYVHLLYGRWYGGWGPWGTGNAFLGVREVRLTNNECPEGPYEFRPGSLQDPCSLYQFWSLHSGGACFLVADGSARFLSYSAAPLLPALATRAGREPAVWPD